MSVTIVLLTAAVVVVLELLAAASAGKLTSQGQGVRHRGRARGVASM